MLGTERESEAVMRYLCNFVFVLIALCLTAGTYEDGKQIISLPYETTGQKHWFATPNGTGDCSSWNHACTFRAAVTKCTSGVLDVIHAGAGIHDLDNGSDATGTTIAADNISIIGMNTAAGSHTFFINAAAAVTNVLILTGDGIDVKFVEFNQSTQTDTDTIHLNIQGTYSSVVDCNFEQSAGAAGTGLLVDNVASRLKVRDSSFYGLVDYGIQTNSASRVAMRNLKITACGKGLAVNGASDTHVRITRSFFNKNTLAVEHSGATTEDVLVFDCQFEHNTTNFTDTGAYDELHIQQAAVAHTRIVTAPATVGVAVATGDGAWAWTAAAVQIVAADTINNPFKIVGINVQTYDVAQTYKIELFYGEAAADSSISISEFTVGAAVANQTLWISIVNLPDVATPATSGIWAKSMSSTDGVDSVTFTISHLEY